MSGPRPNNDSSVCDDKPSRLLRFVSVVRERWWVVLLITAIVGGLVFGVSLVFQPRYRASAALVYSSRDAQLASQALSSSGTVGPAHNISSDALALETSALADRVSRALGGIIPADDLRSAIAVSSDSATDVIEIVATESDPDIAAAIANAFAAEFVKARQEETQQLLLDAQGFVETRIGSLSQEEADTAYGAALKQQRDDLAVLLAMQTADYEILQEAASPKSAYFPQPFRNLWIGLGAGLALAILTALLLGQLDRSIRDASTLERAMDLPILGMVPLVPHKRGKSTSPAHTAGFGEGDEGLLESIRMLRSNLKVLGFGETRRSLLVTSTGPIVSKSALAVDLALTMALSGDRVVLVDADFHSPAIHRYLRIANTAGLGDVLVDDVKSWPAKIQAVTISPFVSPQVGSAQRRADAQAAVPRFLCLTSGSLPSNPIQILESGGLIDLLAELEGISDYVILDGPPLLMTSDSLILAQSVDAVIFASALGKITPAEATQARQLLARAEIVPLGMVICGAKSRSVPSYYYRPVVEV